MSASTGTTVTVLVAALVVLGIAMIGVAVWLVRATRSDPSALGPLEVMGARRWRRGNADRRQTKLDTARPAGAPPPAPIVPFEPAAGDGDGAVVAAEADLESGGAGNGEPSMQESAVSAHSSPDEPDVEPDASANCDASVPESARSGHSSPDEPGDGEQDDAAEGDVVAAADGDGPANSDASGAEPGRSGQSSPEEPTESKAAIEANTKE
jgi:hypothetical protein